MAKLNSKTEKPLFEFKCTLEDKTVYKRIISPKGRNQSEINQIVETLPTATVHHFTEENFNRLKQIEQNLKSQMMTTNTSKSFKNLVLSFLDIK